MAISLSSLTKEYLRIAVEAEASGLPVDPTGNAVEFAFMDDVVSAEPGGGDWNVGDWETDAGPPIIYYARILIGPGGGVVLTDGKFDVWIKITSSPELPVRHIGRLTIT